MVATLETDLSAVLFAVKSDPKQATQSASSSLNINTAGPFFSGLTLFRKQITRCNDGTSTAIMNIHNGGKLGSRPSLIVDDHQKIYQET